MHALTKGRWIALGGCVVLVAALHWSGAPEPRARASNEAPGEHAAPVRIAGDVSVVGEQRPISLDAQRARVAMRDGVLHVALPDGTTYPVRMERQETDAFGQWSVIGRAQTAVGEQAAVLTFGGDAVFGTLPMPDGHSLLIVTNHGKVLASRAGGLAPQARAPGTDIATRSRKEIVAARIRATREAATRRDPRMPGVATNATAATTVAHGATAQALTASAAPPVPTQVITPSGRAQALGGPITVTVLGIYSDDLVALRGSESAIQTEFSNKIAASTQAHIDSGSIVRFSLVGTRKVDIPSWVPNDEVLYAMTAGPASGVDTEAVRDTLAADLVTILRPHASDYIECGIAWVSGNELYAQMTDALFAYAVVNTEPCGPHTTAHELGHLLGGGHDRESDYQSGELHQASFPFAHGLRRDGAFATIMAYSQGEPWVGVYSNPSVAACAGKPCGVADRDDDVRAFNLMAKAVSEFRTAGGKATISGVGAWEGTELRFPVRLNAAPDPDDAYGEEFQVEFDTGNGWFAASSVNIPAGSREAYASFSAHDDGVPGVDRTIRARISSAAGYPVSSNVAVGTTYDNGPKPVVRVRVLAPDGTQGTSALVLGYQGPRDVGEGFTPWYGAPTFDVPVAPGSNVYILPSKDHQRGIVGRPLILNEVRNDMNVDITMAHGVLVSGDATSKQMYYRETLDGHILDEPEYPISWYSEYPRLIYPGATVHLYFQTHTSSWFGVRQEIRKDTVIPGSTTGPALVVHSVDNVREGRAGRKTRVSVLIEVVQPAPLLEPVTVGWRTFDGTAKKGEDYFPASGQVTLTQDLPYRVVFVDIIGDASGEPDEYFTVAIDTGVPGYVSSVPAWKIRIDNDDLAAGGPQPKSVAP